MTQQLCGSSNLACDGATPVNTVSMIRGQCSGSGYFTEIHFGVVGSVSGNVVVGIWADSSGSPGALLGSKVVAVSSGSARTITGALDTPIAAVNGTYYWVGFNASAALVGYRLDAGSRKYKSAGYGALPNPAGTGYTSDSYNCAIAAFGVLNQAVTPSGISAAGACGSPSITITIAPPGRAATASFGSPTVTAAAGGPSIAPAGVASLTAFGTPTIRKQQFITPPGIASLTSAGTPTVTLRLRFIAPAGIATATAFGTPALFRGHIGPVVIAPATVFGVPVLVRFPWHVILEAEYFTEAPQVNHVYVVGQDVTGAGVTGSSITQGDVDLVGGRLEVAHEPAVSSGADAEDVAEAMLARARLDGSRGQITINPHCGLELWDVISTVDNGANQSGPYRVTGYTLEYDARTATYRHKLELSAA